MFQEPLGGLQSLVGAVTEKLAAAKWVTDTQEVGRFARVVMEMPGVVHALTSGMTGKCHCTEGFRFSHYSHYVSYNFSPSCCSSWILTFSWYSCQHGVREREGASPHLSGSASAVHCSPITIRSVNLLQLTFLIWKMGSMSLPPMRY